MVGTEPAGRCVVAVGGLVPDMGNRSAGSDDAPVSAVRSAAQPDNVVQPGRTGECAYGADMVRKPDESAGVTFM